MDNSTLTLGDVLPSNMKAKYADVLSVTVEEAIQIVKYAMPPSSPMTAKQLAEIQEISKAYLSKTDDNTDSSYWNKSETDNASYWSRD